MADRLQEVREFVRECDADLQRVFDFEVEEVRATGDANSAYAVRGTAAVYGKWSLDLGGFRERIKRGAFDEVVSSDPHVLHLWDHDTSRVLSSTRNGTLSLDLKPGGLGYYSRVAKTSYADDLKVLLERGDINQSSFAFTVDKDEWRITESENGAEIVERTIVKVKELFDVTTCAMGAYPTTDAAVAVRNMSLGRDASRAAVVAPAVPAGGGKEDAPAPDPVVTPQASNEDATARAIAEMKRQSRADLAVARERFHRGKDPNEHSA
jgi:HK97 family phage prohead protease